MPEIERYFGRFPPTVRSLALREPRGSRRKIIYLIGLFQHLQGLMLTCDRYKLQVEPADDLSLVLPSAPPLRGWLKLTCLARVDFLKDMVYLFGGLRFCYMYPSNAERMLLLLDARAKTLEVLVLCPVDPRGKQP